MKDKIEELSLAFAKLSEKIEQVKADDYSKPDVHKAMMEDMIYMCRNLSDRIGYLSDATYNYQYQHGKGHLPPIKTAAQMQKALKSCGMEDDYNIEKPSLFISASSKKGLQITASYTKDKK